MRLFLLPISTRQSLIYCQRLNRQLSSETTIVDRLTTKASTTWIGWEKKESGWQKKVTSYGNKLFQRVPHEEWGLKSIPPLSARRKSEDTEGKEEVKILYPQGFIESEQAQETLQRLGGDEKQGFHSRLLWGSIIGMPISAPFALIPVVPNLPFFYLCFRAWSHWRARSGSKHLRFLLDRKLATLAPSPILRAAYIEASPELRLMQLGGDLREPNSESNGMPKTGTEEEQMLLTPSSGKIIADHLQITEIQVEVERAVQQVGKELGARRELEEEKKELKISTKG